MSDDQREIAVLLTHRSGRDAVDANPPRLESTRVSLSRTSGSGLTWTHSFAADLVNHSTGALDPW